MSSQIDVQSEQVYSEQYNEVLEQLYDKIEGSAIWQLSDRYLMKALLVMIVSIPLHNVQQHRPRVGATVRSSLERSRFGSAFPYIHEVSDQN